MSEDSKFLRAVLASPNDNDLRRGYADWLEEHGVAASMRTRRTRGFGKRKDRLAVATCR
jgi:uncharacterized protein (TIGR02996 family)